MAGKGKSTPRTIEMLRPAVTSAQKMGRDMRGLGFSLWAGSVTTGRRGTAGMVGSLIGVGGGDSFTGEETRS